MTEEVKADFADQADELEAKGYRGLAAFLRLTDRRPKQTEVLVPTEVIDPPSKQTQVSSPAPAPNQPSHVHAVLRGMVGQSAIAQAYASAQRTQQIENMLEAARRMSTAQKRALVRGRKR